MAEPRRFHFDSATRSVEVPASRHRVTWYWIAISVAIHAGIVLFALAGTARGGHSELIGTIEITVVGAPSAGDPAGKNAETPNDDTSQPTTVARSAEPPSAPAHEALAHPAPADTAAPVQPPSPASPRTALPAPPAPQPADPEGLAKPTPASAAADAEPKTPKATETPAQPRKPEMAPPTPELPKPKSAAVPKAAPAAKAAADPKKAASPNAASPNAASPKAASPKAASPKQGIKDAPQGQTASLGSPTGGDRLGKSDNDDANGVLNMNYNPRFRSPPPPPHYPRLSIQRDEEGVVLVRAFVDAAGAPQRVTVFKSSGFPLLDDAAVKAVHGWRFEPMVRDGRTMAAWVQVPVRFRLN